MKYLVNGNNNPKYNLAFEEYCFRNLPKGERYFFFWINNPTIVVGKNQNTIEQINEDYINKNGIDVVRRITGGGAVYHDLGNVNYSIISDEDSNVDIDFKRYNQSILGALQRLGLKAELQGRNDIVIEGKKVSGIAQSISKGRVLNHGTLMYDVNLEDLVKSLYVNKDKLVSKGIKSIRSRVTNIKDHLEEDMDIYNFRDFLLENIFDIEGSELEEYILSDREKEEIHNLFEEKYNTWDWNFGRSPKAEYKNHKRFDFGTIDLRFNIENNTIRDLTIYGDFFGKGDIVDVQKLLEGEKYNRESIEAALEDTNLKKYFGDIDKREFIDLLF